MYKIFLHKDLWLIPGRPPDVGCDQEGLLNAGSTPFARASVKFLKLPGARGIVVEFTFEVDDMPPEALAAFRRFYPETVLPVSLRSATIEEQAERTQSTGLVHAALVVHSL